MLQASGSYYKVLIGDNTDRHMVTMVTGLSCHSTFFSLIVGFSVATEYHLILPSQRNNTFCLKTGTGIDRFLVFHRLQSKST